MFAYLLLIVINAWFFPARRAFDGANPHPYLVVILLLACRYGLQAGAVSSLVGALIYWLWAYPLFRLEIWQDPGPVLSTGLVFVLTGLGFGYLRSRAIAREKGLQERISALERSQEVSEKKNSILREVSQQLETRVLMEANSFASLYSISEQLGKLDFDEICEAVPRIIAEQIQADQCSLYVFDQNSLQLKASHGWGEDVNFRRTIPVDGSLVGRACRERTVLSVRDFIDRPQELEFMGESIFAAPLVDEDGHLRGAINVESMPFLRVNRASLRILEVLARWTGEALSKARYFEQVRLHAIEDELLTIYTHRYLEQRLAEEVTRSRINGLPLSLALIHVAPAEGASPRARKEELRLIASYLRVSCREIDIVCNYTDEIPIAVLMTTTDKETASTRAATMRGELNKLLTPAETPDRIRVGLASFEPELQSWEELVEKAEKTLEEAPATVSV